MSFDMIIYKPAYPHARMTAIIFPTGHIVFVFLDLRCNMCWSYRKSLKIICINLCSHCVGGFGTCVGSQRYGFVLFTMEVCVCSCMVFCIKMIWSDVSLYRIDFTFVMNLLWFVSKQLVLKQLCIETTMNQIYCYIHTGYPKGNMNVNQ